MSNINSNQIFKNMAAALPYEMQAVLLELRDAKDDGDQARLNRAIKNIPSDCLFLLLTLNYITADECYKLTDLGERIAAECSC